MKGEGLCFCGGKWKEGSSSDLREGEMIVFNAVAIVNVIFINESVAHHINS